MTELPRLNELASASDSFSVVLNDRSDPVKKKAFKEIEAELGKLPDAAWSALKEKVLPHLDPIPPRGWQQLYDRLNEARGYNYLVDLGCNDVQFIPEENSSRPDLEAKLGELTVYCEVKTVNKSDKEIQIRCKGEVSTTAPSLDQGFCKKLDETLQGAQKQIDGYVSSCRQSSTMRKIIFLVLNFDDHELADQYVQQIQDRLKESNPVPGCEVELFFHPPFYWATAE